MNDAPHAFSSLPIIQGLVERPMLMLVVLGVAGAITATLLMTRQRRSPYVSRQYLFTKAEWNFRRSLTRAVRNDYLVMGKVRIADILSVKKTRNKSKWWKSFSKISQKHIDFVLIEPKTGKFVCCIELDDASHQRKDRIKRDSFVKNAFDKAGIPLLSIPARRQYDVADIREKIQLATTPNTH